MWKDVLAPLVILSQVKSLMIALPVNLAQHLVSHTLFGQGEHKLYVEKSSALITDTQRVSNLESVELQEVNIIKIRVVRRLVTTGKYSFESLEEWP